MIIINPKHVLEETEKLCWKDKKGIVHHAKACVIDNGIHHECIKCTINWKDEEVDDDLYEENFSETDSTLTINDLKGVGKDGKRDLPKT